MYDRLLFIWLGIYFYKIHFLCLFIYLVLYFFIIFMKMRFKTAMKIEKTDHITVYDLLEMPEKQRNRVMERAFRLAEEEGLYEI